MPEAAYFNPFDAKVRGVRGRDRKNLIDDNTWEDVIRIHEFDDGWYIGYTHTAKDIATLGTVMGHCSGMHFIWACEEKIWYFFALFDPGDVPRVTIHGKQATWVDKEHPRDSCEAMPEKVTRQFRKTYPTLEDVTWCFQNAGLVYEPGRYCAPRLRSSHYDKYRKDPYYQGRGSFGQMYGNARNPTNKPDNVDDEVWAIYATAAKAVEDNFNKNAGAVKVVNRRFKFDDKWLIVLSANGKSQSGTSGTSGKKVAEWLNACCKKEKK